MKSLESYITEVRNVKDIKGVVVFKTKATDEKIYLTNADEDAIVYKGDVPAYKFFKWIYNRECWDEDITLSDLVPRDCEVKYYPIEDISKYNLN